MTQQQLALAEKLYEDGLNDREIGNACGVSKSLVRRWRIKNDLPANFFDLSKDKMGEWMIYSKADDTLLAFGTTAECAKTMCISENAFYQLCSRARRGLTNKYEIIYHSASQTRESNSRTLAAFLNPA